MMVIPQIKVCGFFTVLPLLCLARTHFLDGLQSQAAVKQSSGPLQSLTVATDVNVLCLLAVLILYMCVATAQAFEA